MCGVWREVLGSVGECLLVCEANGKNFKVGESGVKDRVKLS